MRILVQKFGGTSLNNRETRTKAVEHIRRARQEGYQVVVVVSAMGRHGDSYATDTLLSLIEDSSTITSRERDMLLSCGEIISSVLMSSLLNQEGLPAVAFTAREAGIHTSEEFGNAQIQTIDPTLILQELRKGKVVVVCGFQGVTAQGQLATLGRGGSDTSATALGAALNAEYVDIFTDVKGIMTADPRIVQQAKPLKGVTYTEICNLAYQGAKVIHPRAVEVAMQHQVPIRVRSTMLNDEGTLVSSLHEVEKIEKKLHERVITGITQMAHITQIKVQAKKGEYDLQLKVFKAMAENKISVDFINVHPLGVVYTVSDQDAQRAIALLEEMGYEPQIRSKCAKISTVGAGMAGVPGVMAKIVEALVMQDITILQSADSHSTIWVLVSEQDMEKAVQALHHAFLDEV